MNVGLGGNIGKSLHCKLQRELRVLRTLEVSSFQLDDIQNFLDLIFHCY